jgi:hypothetical protein
MHAEFRVRLYMQQHFQRVQPAVFLSITAILMQS